MRGQINSPLGPITVSGTAEAVNSVDFGGFADGEEPTGAVRLAMEELEAYFAGTLRRFSFPFADRGTAFQRKVWAALRDIPYGQTETYGQLAARIGSPKASRAVGMAAHRNPIAVATPCHRLVGAAGLTGYAGGLDKKAWLLRHEGAIK